MKKEIKSRELEIETLFEIITNREKYKENSQYGLAILINGPWGSGKTTFINELADKIQNFPGAELFARYDSWEYDFYENPYLPFFSVIEDKLKLGKNLDILIDSTKNLMKKEFFSVMYNVTKSVLKNKFGIDDDCIKGVKDSIDKELDKNDKYFQKFEQFNKIKKRIKDNMKSLCNDTTQVFIIDELDRCNPKFAIETLEIVKHFFDVENCVFVIAVDKEQLSESAKTIFGQNMNADIYFSKFFDYQFNLSQISLFDLVAIGQIKELPDFIDFGEKLFGNFAVSIRDGAKIMNEFMSKCTTNWSLSQSKSMIFLYTMKYIDLLTYKRITKNDFVAYDAFQSKNPSSDFMTLRNFLQSNSDIHQFLNLLNRSFNIEYIEKSIDSYYGYDDEAVKRKNEALRDLGQYVPFIEVGLTYGKTIEKIIN